MTEIELLEQIINKIDIFIYIYLFFNISNLSIKKIKNIINGVGR